MITGMLTMVAANGLFLSMGAMLPPPGERPQPMEQTFARSDRDDDRTIDRRDREQPPRRQKAGRDAPADPRRDAGPRFGSGQPGPGMEPAHAAPRSLRAQQPPDQGDELQVQRALQRAMARTLRRHKAELNQMLREAVEQAMQEVGSVPPTDRPAKPQAFERPYPRRLWQRGRLPDVAGGWMTWRRGHGPRWDGPAGSPEMCPWCKHRFNRSAGPGMGRQDGPYSPGKRFGTPDDGPRHGKSQGDGEPRGNRFTRRFDSNRDGGVSPDEFKGNPERFKKLDRNNDGRLDRKDLKKTQQPRREKKERHEDPPPPEDE
jgi:hypothetical protein